MNRSTGMFFAEASGAVPPRQEDTSRYVPGVCNIGPAEIARRRRSGWIGLVVTIAAWAGLVAFDAPQEARLALFVPAMMAATGFLQAWMHFCAYFGFAALLNFGPETGRTDSVVEAEFRARDRRKAWQIVGYSAVIGLAVALAAYLT